MGLTAVRDVIEHGDFEAFKSALAPDIVWVGVLPGQLCRNRDEVLATFERWLESGHSASPEILGENENLIVVDPHVEPPPKLNPGLHHVFVVDEDEEQIVEMRDFPDRRSALEAAGL